MGRDVSAGQRRNELELVDRRLEEEVLMLVDQVVICHDPQSLAQPPMLVLELDDVGVEVVHVSLGLPQQR